MCRLLLVGQPSEVPTTTQPPAGQENDEVIVGYAGELDEVLACAPAYDLLIVSAALPDHKALDIVTAVSRAQPAIRILVKDLAGSGQAPLSYIKAGATAWLL